MRKVLLGLLIMLMGSLVALPVLAAPVSQEGGVRFGAYTLESGGRATGDLVVFGGPVRLASMSSFRGDLTVFGPVTIEEGADLDGQLIVLGNADLAGTVDGNVFAVDGIVLRSTARIHGDVTVVGTLDRQPGALIDGELRSATQEEAMRWWSFPRGPEVVVPVPRTAPRATLGARVASLIWRAVRALASVVVMGLLATVVASLWPVPLERVGRVIEEAPLVSFGVGFLALLVAALGAALLAITICLSPFAVVGLVVVGVGLLAGWVGLGMVLGRKVLGALFSDSAPTPVVAALVGTTLLTLLLAFSRVFGALHALFLIVLLPPAAGAVLLTRFGSQPYATRQGVSSRPTRPSGPRRSAEGPTSAPRPAPLPREERESPVAGEPHGE